MECPVAVKEPKSIVNCAVRQLPFFCVSLELELLVVFAVIQVCLSCFHSGVGDCFGPMVNTVILSSNSFSFEWFPDVVVFADTESLLQLRARL